MRNKSYGLYAVALAIVVVGALWVGLPVGTLALLGLVLVCPLMMVFMMRGMHGGHGSQDGQGSQDQQHNPAGRPAPHDHSSMR